MNYSNIITTITTTTNTVTTVLNSIYFMLANLLFQIFLSSLLPSSPLVALIGRDILANHRAKLVLTHKLILVRIPSSPHAVHNILGYLAGSDSGREMLCRSLLSALEVWSDPTSIRHMDSRQHVWVSKVLVLGVTLLQGHKNLESVRPSECLGW